MPSHTPDLQFKPEQFHFEARGCNSQPLVNPGFGLDAEVASYLANRAVEIRNSRRNYNQTWPNETQINVIVGTERSHGPRNRITGEFKTNPDAVFGFVPFEGISIQPLVYAAYIKSVLRALDHDEISSYSSPSLRPGRLFHPVRFTQIEDLSRRRDRKLGQMANKIVDDIHRPYPALLFPTN